MSDNEASDDARRPYVAGWSDFTQWCIDTGGRSSGLCGPLPEALGGDDGHGSPLGRTPGPDVPAVGQGHHETPGQGAWKAKKRAKGAISGAL